MTAQNLITKAQQALASSIILLESGDPDGACNRAYYAMFDAARAILLETGYDVGKTHKGVLNAFSEHLVKTKRLPKELGRLLKQAETRRYVADYEGDPVAIGDAEETVGQAKIFVSEINRLLEPVCNKCQANPCVCSKHGARP